MKPHTALRWARLVSVAALVPALAWAQDGPSNRGATLDPDQPVDVSAGTTLHAWTVMNVTGVPGTTLGEICAVSDQEVYLWSVRKVRARPLGMDGPRVVPEPDPGDGPAGGYVDHSALLRWDGTAWSTVLSVRGETAGPLLGCDGRNLFAATNRPDGSIRLYRYQANRWRAERLPDGIRGPAGSLVGEGSRFFLRTGNAILEGVGHHWRVAYVNEALATGTELVDLDRGHILAPSLDGQALWDGTSWTWLPNAEPMLMAGGWGGRDVTGVLHLFGTGRDPRHGGLHIWEYVESAPGTLRGAYVQRIETPRAGPGYGVETWGAGVHDVYVVGVVRGGGCLMRFNGIGWSEIVPMPAMPVPTCMTGTPEGNLWIALVDGRVLHGVRAEPLPAALAPEPPAPGPGVPFDGDVIVRHRAPGSFEIRYELAEARDVTIGVYDVAGRRVARLEQARVGAGTHLVRWDAGATRPGVYFCRVQAGPHFAARRIVVTR